MNANTSADMFLDILKHHVGSVLLCCKHEWLVDIAQEEMFNDIFAMVSMLFTFKSFLALFRHSTSVS